MKDFKKRGRRRQGKMEDEEEKISGGMEGEMVGFADVKIGRDMMHANYR